MGTEDPLQAQLQKVLRYKEFIPFKYQEYHDEDGVMIDWEKWFDYKDEVIVPGAVLRLHDGTLHLVGSINPQLGQCDCCKIKEEDIKEIASLFP